jgi:hypothetical protein
LLFKDIFSPHCSFRNVGGKVGTNRSSQTEYQITPYEFTALRVRSHPNTGNFTWVNLLWNQMRYESTYEILKHFINISCVIYSGTLI